MVGFDEIDFREDCFAMKRCRKVLDVRNWIAIRNCDAVERAVVTTRTPVPRCRLRYHVKWRRPAARRRTDDSKLKHVVEFCFCHFEAVWRKTSGTAEGRRTTGDDVVCDVVFDSSIVVAWMDYIWKFCKKILVGCCNFWKTIHRTWRAMRRLDAIGR